MNTYTCGSLTYVFNHEVNGVVKTKHAFAFQQMDLNRNHSRLYCYMHPNEDAYNESKNKIDVFVTSSTTAET